MTRFFFIISALFLFACTETKKNEENTIQIGKQAWMATNLDVSTFRNGDTIPEAKTNEQWNRARMTRQPAWSYAYNNPANKAGWGKLYNWYAVNDPRGLAPVGWHIPNDIDWDELLKQTKGMMFAVQRGGTRTFAGDFENDGMGFWWSANGNETHDAQYAWFRVVGHRNDSLHRDTYVKGSGFSVRCVKD